MKAQKILAVIVPMLIGIAAFVMVQCTKENNTTTGDSNLAMRETNLNPVIGPTPEDCEPEVVPGAVCNNFSTDLIIQVNNIDQNQVNLIPPGIMGTCSPIDAIFRLRICDNISTTGIFDYFFFYNFRMIIPDNNSCSNLKNYLDNLALSNYELYLKTMNQLSTYIALEAKKKFMSTYVKSAKAYCGINQSVQARIYFANCYKPIEVLEAIPIYDKCTLEEWLNGTCRIIGSEIKKTIQFLPCGSGCCIYKQSYCYNKDTGEVDTGEPAWESAGPCDQISKSCTQRCK